MKSMLKCFVVGLAGAVALGPLDARADLEVGVSFRIQATADFHAPLETHGAWVEIGSYGRCWRPARVAVGWRPYCDGHWVWTDCGWYWESDEPWAWACYHYGNWVYDSHHGWIWIPGIEWAPSWVSWRVGGGYIGWAPLGPAHLRVAVGIPTFVFVESRRFHERHRPSRVIVNNTTIINQTTVINNVRREQRTVEGGSAQQVIINDGPGVEVVQKASGRQFKPTPIQEVARKTTAPAGLRKVDRKDEPRTAPKPDTKATPAAPPQPDTGKAREKESAPTPAKPPTEHPGTPDKVKPAKPDSPGGKTPPNQGKPDKGKGKGRSSDKERGKDKP